VVSHIHQLSASPHHRHNFEPLIPGQIQRAANMRLMLLDSKRGAVALGIDPGSEIMVGALGT
jgi:hypothetical protein